MSLPPEPGNLPDPALPLAPPSTLGAPAAAVLAPPPPPPPPDSPHAPATEMPKHKRRAGWIALGVVGALAVAGTGIVVATEGDPWPSSWDSRAQSLVDYVEANRGGPFDHAVDIEFLPEDDYLATLQDDAALDEADSPEALTDAALLRAIGWIDAGVDPTVEQQELLDDGTLAYYVPGAHRIVVRGEPTTADTIPIELQVTLVHELTHAWQDQRFDLDRPLADSEEEFAHRALIEGDAVRIEQSYLFSLPTDEQDTYFDAYDDMAGDVATDEAPGLEALFAGPYVVGPSFAMALDGIDGNRRVDAAFEQPPTTAEQVMFPAVFDAGLAAVEVAAPAVPEGAEAIGEPVPGGAWELLTTLGGRIDALDAFMAARAWAGGTQQAWRTSDDQVCLGWAISGADAEGAEVLEQALDAWAAAGPDGAATVSAEGTVVQFTACDAGDDTVVADRDQLDVAIALAASHGGFVAQAARDVELAVADCAATGLVTEVDPELFVSDEVTDAEVEDLMATAAGFVDECKGAVVTG